MSVHSRSGSIAVFRHRTRSHCPGCGTAYPRHARTCVVCLRRRDQKSDDEIAAEQAEIVRRRQSDRERRHVHVARLMPTSADVVF